MTPAGRSLTERMERAYRVVEVYQSYSAAHPDLPPGGEEEADRWAASLDTTALVGSRHHTVPRFLLERWADESGRVRVHSRVDGRTGARNIRDLAQKDFYTFVDNDGQKNSSFETLLGMIETPAAQIISKLLNPFVKPQHLSVGDLGVLARFAAFQIVRTPRRRREEELQGEWMAKMMVSDRLPASALDGLSIAMHPNTSIAMLGDLAETVFPLVACRPVALVTLDRPRLYIGDEAVLLNCGTDDGTHHPDCFLTAEQFAARQAKATRKKKGRRGRTVTRYLHMTATVSRGAGVAHELVLPISPRAALVWGDLDEIPYAGPLVRDRLDPAESARFAGLVNDAMCTNALDWIVSTLSDTEFEAREVPPVGPFMRVCDGSNAASLAVNRPPTRIRPTRLWVD